MHDSRALLYSILIIIMYTVKILIRHILLYVNIYGYFASAAFHVSYAIQIENIEFSHISLFSRCRKICSYLTMKCGRTRLSKHYKRFINIFSGNKKKEKNIIYIY